MVNTDSRNALWLSWSEINRIVDDKRIVFFGRGTWMNKTLNYLAKDGDYAVDNSKYEQGEIESDLKIFHPDKLRDENWDEIYIIITTSAFQEVEIQLREYGLTPGKHFCVSPSLKDFNAISRINSSSQTIYIACSDRYLESNKERGGGFYQLDIQTRETKKIINGLCHSIVEGKDCLYLIDDTVGVRILNEDFTVSGGIELPPKSRPHGIAFCPKRDLIFISFSSRDSIGIHDANTNKQVDEVFLSKKWAKTKMAHHHINDLCVVGDTLFVSMFSLSGNWKIGLYDGGLIEFDIDSKKFISPVLRDLWMPHNPMMIKENLYFCDSMRGKVQCGTWKTVIQFNGFVRGLSHDHDFFYVGHSMHRHIHRLKGVSHNTSIDTGVFIVDSESNMTKFISIPHLTDIHALYTK